MEVQHFFDIILSAVMAVFGFLAKHLHGKIEKTSDDLAEFKTHVALNHPTLTSVETRFDKLEVKLDRITDKIEWLVEK